MGPFHVRTLDDPGRGEDLYRGGPEKGLTSLFASYFPADNPRCAAVAVVEEGGHGAQTAAPLVSQVVEAMQDLPATPIPRGAGDGEGQMGTAPSAAALARNAAGFAE